jgi:hypothetical protein
VISEDTPVNETIAEPETNHKNKCSFDAKQTAEH